MQCGCNSKKAILGLRLFLTNETPQKPELKSNVNLLCNLLC